RAGRVHKNLQVHSTQMKKTYRERGVNTRESTGDRAGAASLVGSRRRVPVSARAVPFRAADAPSTGSIRILPPPLRGRPRVRRAAAGGGGFSWCARSGVPAGA